MNKWMAPVTGAFERALEAIRARVSVSGDAGEAAVAVAYSGGLDSSALLHLAHDYAPRHGLKLFAFHIHHGISPNADAWLTHCGSECERLGVDFDARRVKLAGRDESGVEEAARISRYAALGELCRLHGVSLLLTAHHQDDQAETVLLQLLRGSGVAGLAGMEGANTAPDLLGDTELVVARPLLDLSRADLEGFVAARGISYIEDESNVDTRYARNALRHRVMPSFAEYFPGYQQRIVRTAQHAQAAQRLLNELAAQDLERCKQGECIDVTRLRQLGIDRIDNMLRYWLASRGVRMPATAWLNEMRTQLLDARADAQLCVTHPDCYIRRHRDRIFLVPRLDDNILSALPVAFRWNGEARIPFAPYGGSLFFEEVKAEAGAGVDADWLRGQELIIRHRSGGERLKLAPNRPTRSLKHHFQALDVPAWERERLPVVIADGQLLFAAGIGMDCQCISNSGGMRIRLRWQAYPP
jgi:tRNA(Ile)-lysidine synthase